MLRNGAPLHAVLTLSPNITHSLHWQVEGVYDAVSPWGRLWNFYIGGVWGHGLVGWEGRELAGHLKAAFVQQSHCS